MAGAFNLSDFVCILAFSIVHPSSSVLGFCQNRSHLQKQIPMCLLLSLASFLLLPGSSLIYNRMSRVFIALKAYRVIPINVILLFFNILIWLLAPYSSTNMNLSSTEAAACAKSAKLRLSLLLLLIVLLGRTQSNLAQGILLGIVMTASLLGMAYILQ